MIALTIPAAARRRYAKDCCEVAGKSMAQLDVWSFDDDLSALPVFLSDGVLG